jgi:hypothetical protein
MICRQMTPQCILKAPGVENFNQRSGHPFSELAKELLLQHGFRRRYFRSIPFCQSSVPVECRLERGIPDLTICPTSPLTDFFPSCDIYRITKKQRHTVVGPNNSIELMGYLISVVRLNFQLFFLSVIVMVFPDYFFMCDPDRLSGFGNNRPFSSQFTRKTSRI